MLYKRQLMHLSVKNVICLSILFMLLSTASAWGQYSSADCTGPQQDCSQLLPFCDDGTYPDCTGGCRFTPIDPENPHTFIVDERPDGVPNDPHFIFTNEHFLPGCWDFLNTEGELKEFEPNSFWCGALGDPNDIFVFATEGLIGPFPPPAPCGDCSNPPLMRGCPTRYGWFFDIDSDRDGSYDDMEVAFLDAASVPLNFRLLFVPLNWTGTQAQFDLAAQDQINLFANSTGLGGCINTIEGVTLDVTDQNFNTFICNGGCQLPTIREFLRDNGIFSYEYDVVVGLLSAGGSPCAPGCSNTINTLFIEENNQPIMAHEIGHIYSLEDEYCSEEAGGDPRCAGGGDLNPLDAALNCDPNTGMGCCACQNPAAPAGSDACSATCDSDTVSPDDYFVCCDGNDGALGGGSRCTMAGLGSGVGLQNWCQHCLDRLNGRTEFACDNLPTHPFEDLAAVELEISQDGTVQFKMVELGQGRPTRTDIPGSRFQILLDTPDGNLLVEEFDFLNYGSPDGSNIPQESMDFYYKVPVNFPINDPPPMTLTVLDGGVIVFRGTLFGTEPVADAGDDIQEECESPSGKSVTLDGTGSSDPDGDILSYDWSALGITFDDSTIATPTGQFPIGQTDVTLVVRDGVFDSSPDTVSVEIVDLTGPAITCPTDITIECDDITDPSNTGAATATDTCDLNPTITFSDVVTPGECSAEYVIKRTWMATDAHGNDNTCTQTINVDDSTSPEINCPEIITIECDDTTDPSNTGIATATDNCDPAPTVTFSDVTAPGDCPEESVITRTWTAKDACGNIRDCTQTINVADTTPPIIDCNAPDTISPPDAPITFEVIAADNCDEDPSVGITGYDCFMFTKKGKLIDKTESCIVNVEGDTITILDSGGVGDHIRWTAHVEDGCGNVEDQICEVEVINPTLP